MNTTESIIYIPLIVVKRHGYQNKGIGKSMINWLIMNYKHSYHSIDLEVLKSNTRARSFYHSRGFVEKEDRNERLLLTLSI